MSKIPFSEIYFARPLFFWCFTVDLQFSSINKPYICSKKQVIKKPRSRNNKQYVYLKSYPGHIILKNRQMITFDLFCTLGSRFAYRYRNCLESKLRFRIPLSDMDDITVTTLNRLQFEERSRCLKSRCSHPRKVTSQSILSHDRFGITYLSCEIVKFLQCV